MTCRQVRDLLIARDLDSGLPAELETHAAHCPVCAGAAREADELDRLLMAARPRVLAMSPDSSREVFRSAVAQSGALRPRPWRRWPVFALGAAAIAFAAGFPRTARTTPNQSPRMAAGGVGTPLASQASIPDDSNPPPAPGPLDVAAAGAPAARSGFRPQRSPGRRADRARGRRRGPGYHRPAIHSALRETLVAQGAAAAPPALSDVTPAASHLLVLVTAGDTPPPVKVSVTRATGDTAGYAWAASLHRDAAGGLTWTQAASTAEKPGVDVMLRRAEPYRPLLSSPATFTCSAPSSQSTTPDEPSGKENQE
jgi:hypothetical protein